MDILLKLNPPLFVKVVEPGDEFVQMAKNNWVLMGFFHPFP